MDKSNIPKPTGSGQTRVPRPASAIQSKPPTPKTQESRSWAFSFRFWRQIEFFGLDQSDPKWFVSLLEKLSELSKEQIDTFRADGPKKDAWRYHDVKWTQKNIPIQRSDLIWIKSDYLENEVEFPLLQFQVSMALGRVVGFWDENKVFNIVLLDPLHNIQPSKDFNYKVDPCSPLPCKYTSLLNDVEKTKQEKCLFADCPSRVALNSVPNHEHYHDVVILRISEELSTKARVLIERGCVDSIEELLDYGATFIQDNNIE